MEDLENNGQYKIYIESKKYVNTFSLFSIEIYA